jgi:hypothetical protein
MSAAKKTALVVGRRFMESRTNPPVADGKREICNASGVAGLDGT